MMIILKSKVGGGVSIIRCPLQKNIDLVVVVVVFIRQRQQSIYWSISIRMFFFVILVAQQKKIVIDNVIACVSAYTQRV